MNSLSYKELKDWYINNEHAKETAAKYFGDIQPSIFQTGFYSAPSWNWGYQIGIVGIEGTGSEYKTEGNLTYGNDIEINTTKYFEVVTRFGSVEAAREIYIPLTVGRS